MDNIKLQVEFIGLLSQVLTADQLKRFKDPIRSFKGKIENEYRINEKDRQKENTHLLQISPFEISSSDPNFSPELYMQTFREAVKEDWGFDVKEDAVTFYTYYDSTKTLIIYVEDLILRDDLEYAQDIRVNGKKAYITSVLTQERYRYYRHLKKYSPYFYTSKGKIYNGGKYFPFVAPQLFKTIKK